MVLDQARQVVAQAGKEKVPCPGQNGDRCGFPVSLHAYEKWSLCSRCDATRLIHTAEGLVKNVMNLEPYEEAIGILSGSKNAFDGGNFVTAIHMLHTFFFVFTKRRVELLLADVLERSLTPEAREIFAQAKIAWGSDPHEALWLINRMWKIQRRR